MYLSSDDIEPYDWYSRFFGGTRRGLGGGFFDDMFRGFDQMRRQMERDMEKRIPKDLVREYDTPQGGKVREVGPIVCGYSMTIGPDGKPKVREFGNVRVPGISGKGYAAGPQITAEREPLADVMTSDKEVKVVIEMPGVNKESIKVNVHDNSLEVTSNDPQRKYREVIDLPPEADLETAKSNYKNGIVEVVFKKKGQTKPKGKEIKVE